MADKITIDQIRSRKIEEVESSIGSGFAWPTSIDSDGTIGISNGVDHIASCVKRIVYYNHGDLVGNWSFGGGLSGRMFSVNSGSISAEIKEDLENALSAYEPRITDYRVIVAKKEDDATSLVVVLQYMISSTGEYSQLVFPVPKE